MATNNIPNSWQAVIEVRESVSVAVSTITTSLVGLNASVSEVKREIIDVKSDVGSLRGELLSTRIDVMSRMDRLQDKLSAVTDDLTQSITVRQ